MNVTTQARPDVAVVILRGQLVHLGHASLFSAALTAAARVIIVLGSAFRSRHPINPFTWQERRQMIEATLTEPELARVQFLPIRDYYDNERWNAAVRAGVGAMTRHGETITLVGHKKDTTSHYLDEFPGWTARRVEPVLNLSATELRAVYFGSDDIRAALTVLEPYVAPRVLQWLEAWSHLGVYRECVIEHRAVARYRQRYTAPFYLTADAVVTVNQHVLLIKRAGDIGHDLWALPGGFVDTGEQFYEACVRELGEETAFRPLPGTLRAACKRSLVFDHPGRSPRGRLVTMAFHFDLGRMAALPEVQANNPANASAYETTEVAWVPIKELVHYEERLFEDHATILNAFLEHQTT